MPSKRLFSVAAGVVAFSVECTTCDWRWPTKPPRGKSRPGALRKSAVNMHVARTGHTVRTTTIHETRATEPLGADPRSTEDR